MRETIYLTLGSFLGPFEILRLHTDSVNCRDRTYEVKARCCGDVLIRSHRSLQESERLKRTLCSRCAQYQVKTTGLKDQSKLSVGTRIGPITIVGLEGGPRQRRIVWDCCGKDQIVSLQRLYCLRHRANSNRNELCGDCAASIAKRPKSGFVIASAVLPPGVLPAAVAWPRPGVRT